MGVGVVGVVDVVVVVGVGFSRLGAASLLIGLGNYALLKLGEPIGPIIFALGLLGVCYMGLNLFTGKCGFLFQDKIKFSDLMIILAVNLVAGYLIGLLYSTVDADVPPPDQAKLDSGVAVAVYEPALVAEVVPPQVTC